VDYEDGDLDPYHELAVAVLVCEPGSAGRKPAGAFIHQLPVDQSFTCEAGREMWGFPKFIADIDIEAGAHGAGRCTFEHDGVHVLTLGLGASLPVPSRDTALDAFSYREGVLRRTQWSLHAGASRLRIGGARLELGDHPIATELRGLGLPKRALMSGMLRDVRMEFAAAQTA
jgi:hypothetical protein